MRAQVAGLAMRQLEGQLDGDDFPQAASEDIRDDERARDLIE
jgi:hypothetical protein